ncbi:MAG TPA: hypothetical protein VLM05_01425 [Mycobacteriales bacterium]|nr:hypothetical protein [Mycobacteriales bacterium]
MHVYVDESERQDYLLCAVLVPGSPDPLRSALRALCRPGQRRVHFAKENDARRRAILAELVRLGLRARVYTSPGAVKESRELCLAALVADVAPAGARRLILESRESMNHLDVLTLDAALRKHGTGQLEYQHLRPHEEPMLWSADAIAWAVGAGGDWRRRVDPVLVELVRLGR